MREKDKVTLNWASKKELNNLNFYPEIKAVKTAYPFSPVKNVADVKEILANVYENLAGRLIKGDNIGVMLNLLNTGYLGKFDLIYIDPPYYSNSNYSSKIKIVNDGEEQIIKRNIFNDTWPNLTAYLNYIFSILEISKSLLSENGSLFVHVDYHASHYIKILLDELFSEKNFINEIIWCYGGGSNAKRHFHRKHDTIFWYAKSKNYFFNPIYRPYTEKTKERGLTPVKGPKYKLNTKGALMHDWWTDINKILSPTAFENLKYPTQKPIALLERIIKTATNEDSLVGDFFVGSGTTAEAAHNLNRKWVVCDNSDIAITTTDNRLVKAKARPFKIEVTTDTKISQANKLEIRFNRCIEDNSLTITIIPKNKAIFFWEIGLVEESIFKSIVQITKVNNNTKIQEEVSLKNIHLLKNSLKVKAYDYEGNIYEAKEFII